MNQPPDSELKELTLFGRFYAFLSMLPYLAVVALFFFTALFFLIWSLVSEVQTAFEIVFTPFLIAAGVLLPFTVVFLYILHWHGKRKLEFDSEGITMVLPNKHSVFVPWAFLLAIELRFNKPRLVSVTLVSSAMRFSFSTLEMNLGKFVGLRSIFSAGFDLTNLRALLYHLHKHAPQVSWRMSQAFKDQFLITHPPYELEKLKYDDLGSEG